MVSSFVEMLLAPMPTKLRGTHARPPWLPMLPAWLLASLLLAPVLSGCTTPQERAAQAQAEVEQMMMVYGPACTRLGYAAESDAWRSCVLKLSTKHDLQRSASSPGYYGWGPGYWRPNGWWGPPW
jgi:hypothetical protein